PSLLLEKIAAKQRLNGEKLEQPNCSTGAGTPSRFTALVGERSPAGPEERAVREDLALPCPILEIQDGNIAIGNSLRRILSLKVNDSIRVRIRKGTQQDGIDDAKDGGVSADAERQRQDGDGGKGWLFRQHPQGVSQILEQHAQQSNQKARTRAVG